MQDRALTSRPERIIIPALLGLSFVAWLMTSQLGDGAMRVGILTGQTGVHDTAMTGRDMGGHAMAFPLFIATWVVMMIAMMFPAIVPVVLMVHRWARGRGFASQVTIPFVGGYLLLWSATGVVAFAFLVELENNLGSGPGLVRVGGALVVAAGIYQFTPLKDACLRQCRSPLSLLMKHAPALQRGVVGRLVVGARHGAYCLGCCWGLMTVLVLIGMMNLAWMAAVAAVIVTEKALTSGTGTSRLFGLALLMFGGSMLISGVPLFV